MKLINISFLIVIAIITTTSCHRRTVAAASTTPAVDNIEYTDARGNLNLLGRSSRQRIMQAPFDAWFNQNYAAYAVDSTTANQLKPLVKNKTFVIFMGTWCGDSRREVPRMYKLLDYCGVKPEQIELINLDNRDSMYKQGPKHEERGLYIHRVPHLLVYDQDKEKGRIVETPVTSLEKDLLAILDNKAYRPQYPGTAYLVSLFQSPEWVATPATLEQTAEQLRPFLRSWGELAAFGRVLLISGETDKAITTHRINVIIYPNQPDAFNYLAAAYVKKGDITAAKTCCQKVLQLQPGNQQATAMLDQLNKKM